MPARDLDLLLQAAEQAGRIALRYWKQSPRAWDKDDGAGPVTEADLAVNDHLHATLRAARPHYGWLSEETPDTPARLSTARQFVIDPIDGTRAFIAGEAAFALALAVVAEGAVIAGVVALPAMGLVYAARTDGTTTLNGAPVRVNAAAALPGARALANAAALGADLWPGGVPQVTRSFRPSLAWRMCLVADGQFDALITPRPAWEWDIAAGALIIARAGGTVSDRDGAALRFNAPDPRADGLIAAPPALHADLMALRRR